MSPSNHQPATPDHLARAAGGIGRLAVHVGRWSARDRYQPGPDTLHPRAEVNRAVETIDVMLRELHSLRSKLVSEMRSFDDETARRTDALLAKGRETR